MKKSNFSTIKWIFDIYRPFRSVMIVIGVGTLIIQGAGVVIPYVWGQFIDQLYQNPQFFSLLSFLCVYLILRQIQVIGQSSKDSFELKNYDFKVDQRIASVVYDKIFSLSIGQHTNQHSGIKQSIISRGQHSMTSLVYMCSYDALAWVVRILIALIAIAFIFPIAFPITFFGSLLFLFLAFRLNKKALPFLKRFQKIHLNKGKKESDIMRNLSLIKTNAQEKKATGEIEREWKGTRNFGMRLWTEFVKKGALTRDQVIIFVELAVLLLASYLVTNKTISPANVLVVSWWLWDINSNLRSLGRAQRQFMDMWAAVRRLHQFVDIDPDVVVVSEPKDPNTKGDIRFENVSFRYPIRKYIDDEEKENKSLQENDVLKNVSFVIPHGKKTAIVGESGAGKSTIAQLLMRAFDPEEGIVALGSDNLKDVDLKKYLQNIGYVEQDVSMLDGTLRYNILYGLNGRSKSITKDDLELVSEKSRINQFFDKLEYGFDTVVGERGTWLSVGQKQRVGIARALIKNPDILIFDEATSSLDSENEKIIQESIDDVSDGRTVIVIAHRLSTIRSADKIVVLSDGRVFEEGTHLELIEKQGRYFSLVKAQDPEEVKKIFSTMPMV